MARDPLFDAMAALRAANTSLEENATLSEFSINAF